MVFHLITGAITAFIIYTAVPGSDLFSWHPTLMTTAFCLLMSQAIAIFSPESPSWLVTKGTTIATKDYIG